LDRVEIKDAFGFFVVANRDGISSQAQDIPYTPGVGNQKLGLEGKPIAVTTSHLQYRVATSLFDSKAATKGRKAHHRTLVIGNIQRSHLVFEKVNVVQHLLNVCPLGWTDLAGYHKVAGIKDFSKGWCHFPSFAQTFRAMPAM
jgi:hypothetical protein